MSVLPINALCTYLCLDGVRGYNRWRVHSRWDGRPAPALLPGLLPPRAQRPRSAHAHLWSHVS